MRTKDEVLLEMKTAHAALKKNKFDEAMRLYHDLIDRDDGGKGFAAYSIGAAFHAGIGVEKDRAVAEQYYRLADSEGDAKGSYWLGILLAQTKRQPEALPKFKRVAMINPSAAYWVYRILESHPMLSEHPGESEKFLALAEKQGHLIARRLLIQRQMNGAEGLTRIPIGLARFVRLIFDIFLAGYKDEKLLYR